MNFSERFIKTFQTILPSPFTIAILLTILTFLIALLFTSVNDNENPKIEALENRSFKLSAPKGKSYFWEPSEQKTPSIVFDANKENWCSVKISSEENGYLRRLNFGFNKTTGEVVVINDSATQFTQLIDFWKEGLWNNGLIVFAFQMMLLLVLGHVLALTEPVKNLIDKATKYCNTSAKAAAIVGFLTIVVGFINWGLALIFGAIFARKVGDAAQKNGWKINYPLIGAAGYTGLLVWHGGISGSSLIKVAEKGHIQSLMKGIVPDSSLATFPDAITFKDTVFSSMNIFVAFLLVTLIPLALFWLGKKSEGEIPVNLLDKELLFDTRQENYMPKGAEKLDYSKILSFLVGTAIVLLCILEAFKPSKQPLGFITPNYINFCLLGLAIAFHQRFDKFLRGVEEAIKGASGILIQFPLYFGIMGIMNSSGLVNWFSAFFVSISNEVTYPLFTFLSAGIVNMFVPSGGGQWGVQGPIILQSSTELGVPLPKSILALAYGDQLTNMLQPFWALPLLGITGLKAKEILPYTIFLFLLGGVIFTLGLLSF